MLLHYCKLTECPFTIANNLNLIKCPAKIGCKYGFEDTESLLEHLKFMHKNKILYNLCDIKLRNGIQTYIYLKFNQIFRVTLLLDNSLHIFVRLINSDEFVNNYRYKIVLRTCELCKEYQMNVIELNKFLQIQLNDIRTECNACDYLNDVNNNNNKSYFISISMSTIVDQ